VFGITCGFTLGEYIRRRRLTLAGNDLLTKKMKVIDVAFKYGYETPESFSRTFYKFHGIMPSQVKNGCSLKSFSRLSVKPDFIGGSEMTYKIEEKSEIILVGYKKRFTGVPYGEERVKQEEAFLTSTRAKQWLLIGASCDYSTDYMVVTNIDDDGYDFYVAYELDEWTRKELFNPKVTGVDFMDKMDFEIIVIPKQTYVVFETEKKKRPIADYTEIRKKIIAEWLPSTNYVFTNKPEVVAMHWRPNGEWEKERYIEIRLPIEKDNK
jgi:AraC family transcriptional regulator